MNLHSAPSPFFRSDSCTPLLHLRSCITPLHSRCYITVLHPVSYSRFAHPSLHSCFVPPRLPPVFVTPFCTSVFVPSFFGLTCRTPFLTPDFHRPRPPATRSSGFSILKSIHPRISGLDKSGVDESGRGVFTTLNRGGRQISGKTGVGLQNGGVLFLPKEYGKTGGGLQNLKTLPRIIHPRIIHPRKTGVCFFCPKKRGWTIRGGSSPPCSEVDHF